MDGWTGEMDGTRGVGKIEVVCRILGQVHGRKVRYTFARETPPVDGTDWIRSIIPRFLRSGMSSL